MYMIIKCFYLMLVQKKEKISYFSAANYYYYFLQKQHNSIISYFSLSKIIKLSFSIPILNLDEINLAVINGIMILKAVFRAVVVIIYLHDLTKLIFYTISCLLGNKIYAELDFQMYQLVIARQALTFILKILFFIIFLIKDHLFISLS